MIFILTRKKTRERERERERGHDILQNVLSIKYTNRKYAHGTRCKKRTCGFEEIHVAHLQTSVLYADLSLSSLPLLYSYMYSVACAHISLYM
jgi:hypothetical protein